MLNRSCNSRSSGRTTILLHRLPMMIQQHQQQRRHPNDCRFFFHAAGKTTATTTTTRVDLGTNNKSNNNNNNNRRIKNTSHSNNNVKYSYHTATVLYNTNNMNSIPPPPSSSSSTQPPSKYNSHEYPWATEPPIITRTLAKDVVVVVASNTVTTAVTAAADVPTASSTTTSTTTEIDPPIVETEQQQKLKEEDVTTSSSSSSSLNPPSTTDVWSTITGFFTNLIAPSSSSTQTTTPSAMSSFASISSFDSNTDTSNNKTGTSCHEELDDPFDDKRTLSDAEKERIRQTQKMELTQLIEQQTKSSLQPITKTIPSYVPISTNTNIRPVPETMITTLNNGVRIVSQETYGHVSTIGMVCNMGSRYETSQQRGITNMLELLAFGTSNQYTDANHIQYQLQQWLGNRFVHTGREQSMYGIDILRANVPAAIEMLADCILHPHHTTAEIQHAKDTIHFILSNDEIPPEFIMSEAINTAAYGSHQQLGQVHQCPISNVYNITQDHIQKWYKSHVIHNPKGIVIGGAGIDHDTLCQLGEQYFGRLQQDDISIPRTPMIPSKYTGGSQIITIPPPIDGGEELTPEQYSVVHREKRLTRMALAIEIGGWHHTKNLVPMCVLQTLLGGGSSFSAGGPGKGMYSRLYRQILNRYHWAESAEAFTSFHNESGLMGMSGRTEAKYTADMIKTFCLHFKRLAVEPVSEEELDRARNMLRNDVLSQLESRFVLFEDMSRQVLTFGYRESIYDTITKIDAVTANDIQQIIYEALQSHPPTYTVVGVDVNNVPSYEQVCEWLKR